VTPKYTPSLNFLQKAVTVDQLINPAISADDLLICIYFCTSEGRVKGNLVVCDD